MAQTQLEATIRWHSASAPPEDVEYDNKSHVVLIAYGKTVTEGRYWHKGACWVLKLNGQCPGSPVTYWGEMPSPPKEEPHNGQKNP